MRIYKHVMVAIIAVVALSMAAPAAAQTQRRDPDSGIGVGALGGITWTSVNTENNPFNVDFGSDTGYMLGIWFGGGRDHRVGVMGEASWVVKKYKASAFGESAEEEVQYVEIPVLLRINTGSLNRNKPSLYFLVGPVFDIQVGQKETVDGVETPSSDLEDFYQGLDIGAMVGVGFEAARIGIEGRYSWGLKSVLGTDDAEAAGFGSVKLNTFQLVFKVRFN